MTVMAKCDACDVELDTWHRNVGLVTRQGLGKKGSLCAKMEIGCWEEIV